MTALDSKERFSRLQCIACDKEHDPLGATFRCTDCGDLLMVNHDLERLGAKMGDLKSRFDERLRDLSLPNVSGVWRYREMILPDLPTQSIVSLPEGNTALYRRAGVEDYLGVGEVYIKHEGQNPTLSFKDRGMTAGVSWAVYAGAKRVACASTGDTSAAMAGYAAAANLPAVVLLPHEKVSVEQLAQPIAYGAQVLALDTDFDGCMKLVKQLTESGEIYLLNSMNPFRIEGQKAIGIEALHQLGWKVPDWFVIPVGNAGNISALGKGLLEAKALGLIDRLPRIAGIQATAADPFYQSYQGGFAERIALTAKETVASAIRIGDPVSFDKAKAVVQKLDGVVSEASDEAALDAMAVAAKAGVHICPNSAVALAGAKRLREEQVIGKEEKVVVIATAHGGKFSKTTIGYHTGGAAEFANPPTVLAADLTKIGAALASRR